MVPPKPFEIVRPTIWATLEDFEKDILVRFKTFGLYTASPKGEWIRGYLKAHPPGEYPYALWKGWKVFCELAGELTVKIRSGDYQAFRTYIHLLKQLGLITYYAKDVPTPTGRRSNWYTIVLERQDDPAWRRPFQTKYPKTDWTIKSPEEKERLRRKYKRK